MGKFAPAEILILGQSESRMLSRISDATKVAIYEKTRAPCTVRQVNMTISLAFLAPKLVRAAVEGRLPRGINIERLRDAPAEWKRQFEVLGLDPQQ
jgi:hypothetical protein